MGSRERPGNETEGDSMQINNKQTAIEYIAQMRSDERISNGRVSAKKWIRFASEDLRGQVSLAVITGHEAAAVDYREAIATLEAAL